MLVLQSGLRLGTLPAENLHADRMQPPNGQSP